MQKSSVAFSVFQHGYTPYGYGAGVDEWRTVAFNGESRDPFGLYHLGHGRRVYSCSLMRFCSVDSLSPFLKGGLNAYAYCAGDPVNFSDPSGAMRRFMVKVQSFWKSRHKKVTWGGIYIPNQLSPTQRNQAQRQEPNKSILKTKNTGPLDTKPPADPINYDVAEMTHDEYKKLYGEMIKAKNARKNYKWNSEYYRKADAYFRRVNRLVGVQNGIRQDRGAFDLTKSEFRYQSPSAPGAYPEEPAVDYD